MVTAFGNISIPFRNEIYEGLGEIHGRLRIAEAELLLEYRMKDAVFGLLRSRVREQRIPLIDIESIEFHDGWFRKNIIIRSAGITSFSDIPGAESGILVLKITRRDRDLARLVVSRIQLAHSEQQFRKLDSLGEELDRL